MTSNDPLLQALLIAGIIQFGYFIDDGTSEPAPLRLQFELLPAYPQVLEQAAEAVSNRLKDAGLQRLVCGQDSLPLAVCVSQKMGIPLIYNRSSGMVGAYDVGHPAALIANVYSAGFAEGLKTVKARAERTGLELVSEVYLIGLSVPESPTAHCLIVMGHDLLAHWVQLRWITASQRIVIEAWLTRQPLTHHPD